eukprot:1805144-Pyramimonas_sp.AAC.1
MGARGVEALLLQLPSLVLCLTAELLSVHAQRGSCCPPGAGSPRSSCLLPSLSDVITAGDIVASPARGVHPTVQDVAGLVRDLVAEVQVASKTPSKHKCKHRYQKAWCNEQGRRINVLGPLTHQA